MPLDAARQEEELALGAAPSLRGGTHQAWGAFLTPQKDTPGPQGAPAVVRHILPPLKAPQKSFPNGRLPSTWETTQTSGGDLKLASALRCTPWPHHHGFELHAAGEEAAATKLQGFPQVLLTGFGDA